MSEGPQLHGMWAPLGQPMTGPGASERGTKWERGHGRGQHAEKSFSKSSGSGPSCSGTGAGELERNQSQ